MKTDFEARPVYLQDETRIKAHFFDMFSFISHLPLSGKEFRKHLYLRNDFGQTQNHEFC